MMEIIQHEMRLEPRANEKINLHAREEVRHYAERLRAIEGRQISSFWLIRRRWRDKAA
jgi:hypothetical protein